MALDARRIQKPAKKLRKLLKKMPSVPSIEDIHIFRTNARRMETTLEVFSLDSTGNGRRLSKEISRLRKRAGKVRDMDVLTEYISALPKDDSERECSVQLLEYLGAQRQKQVKKFQAARRKCKSDLRHRLKRNSRQICNTLPPDGKGELGGEPLLAKLAASALTIVSQLREPQHLGRTNLHPYRLKVKKLRNVLQMAKNANQQIFVERLDEVKDAIGEWHDWEVLTSIAKDVLNHGRDCRLQHELHVTAEAKYRKALTLAQAMRREFLRDHGRKGLKRQVRPPAQSVWSATAALAA